MKAFRFPQLVPLAACSILGTLAAQASVSYNTANSLYLQNFDSLPNTPENASLGATPAGWTDDNAAPGAGNFSIAGWYLYYPTATTEGGFNGHQRFRNSGAPGNTGSFYSLGQSGSTERALGDIGANTLAPDGQTGNDAGNIYIALRLSNNTGQTLDNFTLSYTGEQWRDGGVSTAETMSFGYSTIATANTNDATFFGYSSNIVNVASLGWTTPKATATIATLNGNDAANRVLVNAVTVSGINWQPGTDLWLRWTDPQLSGKADAAMAIDDLSFSADIAVAPEPSTAGLIGLGFAALAVLRRKSKETPKLQRAGGSGARK
ncbi:MAG TPA: PEP-CTERM sorting domain-containing protein [Candidatus Dormibacteraeota bacterium]|nr:PEP-CTERM sorting domain-containing protein [Candidatus Dormibacteraeota bacterium]